MSECMDIVTQQLTVKDGDTIVLTFDTIVEKKDMIEFSRDLLKQYEKTGVKLHLIVLHNNVSIEQLTEDNLSKMGLQRVIPKESLVTQISHKTKDIFFSFIGLFSRNRISVN
jgi:3'-phosphoadenosine 5'-phosphosulfate sulfotransferase (PAPS reductase)/FAD synthetase